MKNVLQLVDSISYVENNCFQHQLRKSLQRHAKVDTVELSTITDGRSIVGNYDVVVSCLKQRSLLQNLAHVSRFLRNQSIVVYDQDPWHAYMDDSLYKGAYDRISQTLNVSFFALTTQWWVDFVNDRGLPSKFVSMWVLPEYCIPRPDYVKRSHVAGFIGTVHPRRQRLIDVITAEKMPVHVIPGNNLAYPRFLEAMSTLRCFVHSESMPIFVDGKEIDFGTSMWVKDVEAASQGCFSIRERCEGSETYLKGIETTLLYDDINEVPRLLCQIESLDPIVRQMMLDRTVNKVRSDNRWSETVKTLIS